MDARTYGTAKAQLSSMVCMPREGGGKEGGGGKGGEEGYALLLGGGGGGKALLHELQ